MPLTRIDSAFLDLDAIGGIDFDVQSGVPTLSVDATNHRVGIGTNSPAEKLEVYGNGRFKATDGSHGIELYPDVAGLGYQRIISYNRTSSAYEDLSIGVNDFIITTGSSPERLRVTSDGEVRVPDNGKFTAGAGDDLQIFHDGSNNYILGSSGNIILKNSSSNYLLADTTTGAVELNYNGSKKLETTSAGVTVTGTALTTALSTGAAGTGINISTDTITGPATLTIDPAAIGDNTGTVVIAGNLQVDGTTTTINSTTLTVDDKNIMLASGAANAAAADGAGIEIDGADATLLYKATPDAWSFNKRLGIGTDDPKERLHVEGEIVQSSNKALMGNLYFDSGWKYIGNGAGGAVKWNASYMQFITAAVNSSGADAAASPSTSMVIKPDGNVGIGTEDPADNLHVLGSATISNDTATTGNQFSTLVIGERLAADAYASIQLNYNGNNISSKIDGRNGEFNVWANWNSTSSERLTISGTSATESVILRPGGVDVIKANHNASTGTSATYFKGTAHFQRTDTSIEGGDIRLSRAVDDVSHYSIDVYGNSTTNPRLRFVNVPESREEVHLNHTGNIGIGTNNATTKVVVHNGVVKLQGTSGGEDARVEFSRVGGRNSWIGIPSWDDDALMIYGPGVSSGNYLAAANEQGEWIFNGNNGTTSTEGLRIDQAGNVGIGTNNPSGELHIYRPTGQATTLKIEGGSPELWFKDIDETPIFRQIINANGWNVQPGTGSVTSPTWGSVALIVDESGNVGIGTDPAVKLAVHGTGTVASFGNLTAGVVDQIDIVATSGYPTIKCPSSSDTLQLASLGSVKIAIDTNNNTTESFEIVHGGQNAGGNRLMYLDENGNFKVHQTVAGWSNSTDHPILMWDYKVGPGDMMYMASGGNTAIADQMALVISDGHGFKVGKSGFDGTDTDISSSNEFFRVTTSGNVGIGTNNPSYQLHVHNKAYFRRGIGVTALSSNELQTRSPINSGFYEINNATTANGWPVASNWFHLTANTHSNGSNYYSQQFASSFFDQELYFRNTNTNATTTSQSWGQVMHTGSTLKPVYAESNALTADWSRYWYPGGEYYVSVHGITAPGDLNDMLEQGYYHVANTATNNPISGFGYLNIHRHQGSQYSLQHFNGSSDAGRQWMRASYPDANGSNGRSWGSWYSFGALERENTFTTRQHIIGPSSTATFTGLVAPTSSNRAQLVLHSDYSDLVISSAQTNTNGQGSTLTFATSNPADAADYNKFVINKGNWSARTQMLTFGYENTEHTNPHSYINSGDNVMTLDGANKRVGIGAKSEGFSPAYPLDVNFDGDSGARIKCHNSHASLYIDAASGSGGYIRFRQAGSDKFWITNDSSNNLNFRPNGGDTAVQFANGGKAIFNNNVGIGTADPSYKLHVHGVAAFYAPAPSSSQSDDWQISPITIRERLPGGTQTGVDKESPNLNFHWGGRVSNSLWMGSNGQLNWGSYSGSGEPAVPADGDFSCRELDLGGNGGRLLIGPNSANSRYLRLGTTPGSANNTADISVTNGNLHVDAAVGNYAVYLNWYGGTSGMYVGDGSSNQLFRVDGSGNQTAAGTKSFQIAHPLPSKNATHQLFHASIESPQADNNYNGMVTLVDGRAEINIDTEFGMTEGTFEALNKNIRRTVTNESGWTAVKSSITGNILTIEAQDPSCTDECFWMVIGQRKDQVMIESRLTDDQGNFIVERLNSEVLDSPE